MFRKEKSNNDSNNNEFKTENKINLLELKTLIKTDKIELQTLADELIHTIPLDKELKIKFCKIIDVNRLLFITTNLDHARMNFPQRVNFVMGSTPESITINVMTFTDGLKSSELSKLEIKAIDVNSMERMEDILFYHPEPVALSIFRNDSVWGLDLKTLQQPIKIADSTLDGFGSFSLDLQQQAIIITDPVEEEFQTITLATVMTMLNSQSEANANQLNNRR